MSIKERWPNNKPVVTTQEKMAKRGMALECLGPVGPFCYQEAWFVDIFGRRELHLLRLQEGKP